MNPLEINYGQNAQNNYLQNLGSSTSLSTPNNSSIPSLNNSGIGWNMDTLKLGLGGIQTLGNLWNAWQAQQLAKEQFNYTKKVTDQNMSNQLQSYNTSLEDRIRSRTAAENGTQSSADEYISKNRLQRQY